MAENEQLTAKQQTAAKPGKKKPRGKPWGKGQSGNPNGPPTDPGRKDALELLKANAPAVAQKALDLVLCDKPDTAVLRALLQKIFPDNLNLSGGENPLRIFLEKYNGRLEV